MDPADSAGICRLFAGLTVKDRFEILSWAAAIVVGAITAATALWQMFLNRRQRKEELHWRQAETARRLLDELNQNEAALDAMAVLETLPGRLRSKEGRRHGVYSRADIAPALTLPTPDAAGVAPPRQLDDRLAHLCECFEWYLHYLNRIAHAVETGLVRFEDVQPVAYYVSVMAGQKALFQAYIVHCGWTGLLRFLDRFDDWRDAR